MFFGDMVRLSYGALRFSRLRSGLTALGIAVGVAAVVLLTSIGEGVHGYVMKEFSQFGTHLVAINPGKTSTHGVSVGVFGTNRPLTIDDSLALQRLPSALAVVPVVQGNAEVEFQQRRRRTTVYGVGDRFAEAFTFHPVVGRFLPADDPRSARALVVLGAKVRQELFADANPLGRLVRVGSERYRVIGVMESKGQILGVDLDDAVYVPVARAQELFNRVGLMEIDILYRPGAGAAEVAEGVRKILVARHGREDFTITTQEQMLEVLGSVLDVLTFAVAALGAISLFVGAIGIVTIMSIAVNERVGEIGLLRALGAGRGQILLLFIMEALVLAALGGGLGLLLGIGGATVVAALLPALPVQLSWPYVAAAEGLALGVGLLAGAWPARQAARLDPVEALRTE